MACSDQIEFIRVTMVSPEDHQILMCSKYILYRLFRFVLCCCACEEHVQKQNPSIAILLTINQLLVLTALYLTHQQNNTQMQMQMQMLVWGRFPHCWTTYIHSISECVLHTALEPLSERVCRPKGFCCALITSLIFAPYVNF